MADKTGGQIIDGRKKEYYEEVGKSEYNHNGEEEINNFDCD